MRHQNELQEQQLMVYFVIFLLKPMIQPIQPPSGTHPSDSLALTRSPYLSATASNGLQNTTSSKLIHRNQDHQRSKFRRLDHILKFPCTLQAGISIWEGGFWG